jgi:chemotaxis response regulator CheB
MSFVVLQHLAPGHESALTEILARGNAMRVLTARDGMRLEPGGIYVAPPMPTSPFIRGSCGSWRHPPNGAVLG